MIIVILVIIFSFITTRRIVKGWTYFLLVTEVGRASQAIGLRENQAKGGQFVYYFPAKSGFYRQKIFSRSGRCEHMPGHSSDSLLFVNFIGS